MFQIHGHFPKLLGISVNFYFLRAPLIIKDEFIYSLVDSPFPSYFSPFREFEFSSALLAVLHIIVGSAATARSNYVSHMFYFYAPYKYGALIYLVRSRRFIRRALARLWTAQKAFVGTTIAVMSARQFLLDRAGLHRLHCRCPRPHPRHSKPCLAPYSYEYEKSERVIEIVCKEWKGKRVWQWRRAWECGQI